ncbi:hypothetical protein A9E74_02686 [Methylophaga muralis]|uniref:Uncharacterized protein n=1 Tax=Methylophaga muralis TaxID=291169 RepID=A0A1E3GN99_9GAMM|nr:hypothetical protein A9E74_02686 [Methylophaga muralis]
MGLSPADFELELTETGIMHDPETAIEIIKKLKQETLFWRLMILVWDIPRSVTCETLKLTF